MRQSPQKPENTDNEQLAIYNDFQTLVDQNQRLSDKRKRDIDIVIELMKFIRVNSEWIAYAVDNKNELAVYRQTGLNPERDQKLGVLRDFNGFGFHINGYQVGDGNKASQDFLERAQAFETIISQLNHIDDSEHKNRKIHEFAETFSHNDQVGCLEARINEPLKWGTQWLHGEHQTLQQCVQNWFSQSQNPTLEDAFQHFQDQLGLYVYDDNQQLIRLSEDHIRDYLQNILVLEDGSTNQYPTPIKQHTHYFLSQAQCRVNENGWIAISFDNERLANRFVNWSNGFAYRQQHFPGYDLNLGWDRIKVNRQGSQWQTWLTQQELLFLNTEFAESIPQHYSRAQSNWPHLWPSQTAHLSHTQQIANALNRAIQNRETHKLADLLQRLNTADEQIEVLSQNYQSSSTLSTYINSFFRTNNTPIIHKILRCLNDNTDDQLPFIHSLYESTLSYLLPKQNPQYTNVLMLMFCTFYPTTLQTLVSKLNDGALDQCIYQKAGWINATILHMILFSYEANIKTLIELLTGDQLDWLVTQQDNYGQSPLHLAAQRLDSSTFESLINKITPDIINQLLPQLMMAEQSQKERESRPSFHLMDEEIKYMTLFDIVATFQSPKTFEKLLDKCSESTIKSVLLNETDNYREIIVPSNRLMHLIDWQATPQVLKLMELLDYQDLIKTIKLKQLNINEGLRECPFIYIEKFFNAYIETNRTIQLPIDIFNKIENNFYPLINEQKIISRIVLFRRFDLFNKLIQITNLNDLADQMNNLLSHRNELMSPLAEYILDNSTKSEDNSEKPFLSLLNNLTKDHQQTIAQKLCNSGKNIPELYHKWLEKTLIEKNLLDDNERYWLFGKPRVKLTHCRSTMFSRVKTQYQKSCQSPTTDNEQTAINKLKNGKALVKVVDSRGNDYWQNFLEQFIDPVNNRPELRSKAYYGPYKWVAKENMVVTTNPYKRNKPTYTATKKQAVTWIGSHCQTQLFGQHRPTRVVVGISFDSSKLAEQNFKRLAIEDKGTVCRRWHGNLRSVIDYRQFNQSTESQSIHEFKERLEASGPQINECLVKLTTEAMTAIVIGSDTTQARQIAIERQQSVKETLGIDLPIIFYNPYKAEVRPYTQAEQLSDGLLEQNQNRSSLTMNQSSGL